MLKYCVAILCVLVCNGAIAGNAYTDEYGISKIIPAREVYPDFKQGDVLAPTDASSNIVIVIGSTNKIKSAAAEDFIANNPKFKNKKRRFVLVKAESAVAEQPIGLKNGILGASNRIKSAKKIRKQQGGKTNVYYVAIENFFSELPVEGKPTDHAIVIIETPNGKQNVYLSDGVEICRDIYTIVVTPQNFSLDHTGTKSTIGAYLAFKYRVDKNDWFSFVLDKPYTRQQQIASAFKNALPKEK